MTDGELRSQTSDPFWDDPEVVERFASRDPDLRLQAMVEAREDPEPLRVLDVGCAGGRNTAYLAEEGADVHAVDASPAMVERTRTRVARILGVDEARRRVRLGSMTDMPHIPDGGMDVVVALGVLHTAPTPDVWDRAVAEIARVLSPGGRALVSDFSPASRPDGEPLEPAAEQPGVYYWREGRVMTLLDPDAHDDRFRRHGFVVDEETETVHVPLDEGFRITINALYRRS